MKIVLATNNAHKLSEFRSCFEQNGVNAELVSVADIGFTGKIIEDADSFEGNAYIKAKTLCDFSGMISVADDSGLIVDCLGNEPGVYSARYAGENSSDRDNIDKLLSKLALRPDRDKTARFVCCICVCRPDGKHIFVRGESVGEIISELRGEGTFGYDPVFYYPPLGKTFAEMTPFEKNSVSHRGAAIAELLKNKEFFE